MGGIHQIVNSLIQLNKKYQVQIVYNSPAEKLKFKDDRIISVVSKDREFPADIVVNNADYHFFETRLLPKKFQSYPENYWKSKIIAPSAFIIYLGLNKKIKNLNHHNLYLQNNWQEHFDQIFKKSRMAKSSFLLCVCTIKN